MEEIKEAGGLGRKAMSIMVVVMVMVMILIVSMVMLAKMEIILIVSMVMLAPRSCLGIPVRCEPTRGGGGDGKVGQC